MLSPYRPLCLLCAVAGLLLAGTRASIAQTAHITILHTFAADPENGQMSPDGEQPCSLVVGSDGNLYGVTQSGGPGFDGTLFKVTPDAAFTLLYTFSNLIPSQGKVLASGADGNIYGVTSSGGSAGAGTAFRITPSGVFTLLHSFQGGTDGSEPTDLILGRDGNFYGTTWYNTVFQLTPQGSVTPVPGSGKGSGPPRWLMQGSNGDLYVGTNGGSGGGGTIDEYNLASGSVTLFHEFTDLDGVLPNKIVQWSDGNFYGTTSAQGPGAPPPIEGWSGSGDLFSLTPTGNYAVLYSFNTSPYNGDGNLVVGADGNLYGVSPSGGWYGKGALYQFIPGKALNLISSFNGNNGGDLTILNLISGSGGALYGTSAGGGANGTGTVFRVDLNYKPPPDFNGDGHPDILWQNQATGEVVYTFMNGLKPLAWGKLFEGVDPSFHLVGTPTPSLTGQPGVLWQNTGTGKVVITSMHGTSPTAWNILFPTSDTHWKIVGTPDLNLDGNPDLLWQNDVTGEVVYTLMRGMTPISWGIVAQGVDPNYKVVATAHLDGDGYPDPVNNGSPDLLWQNQVTGDVMYTLMNGTTPVTWGTLIQGIDPHYKIVGARDLDGDGYTDILFQNQSTGKVVYALMQFPNVKAWGTLFTGLNPNWEIVGLH